MCGKLYSNGNIPRDLEVKSFVFSNLEECILYSSFRHVFLFISFSLLLLLYFSYERVVYDLTLVIYVGSDSCLGYSPLIFTMDFPPPTELVTSVSLSIYLQ